MSDNKKSGIPWSKIIIGIIIYALFMLWATQRNENEQSQQEFAMQTARANNQKAISMDATQEIENKIRDCIGVYEASRYIGTEQCIIGELVNWEESTEPRDEYTAPEVTYAYFDEFAPNTLYLFSSNSDVFLGAYVGDCVKVWGKILVDDAGNPALSIYEHDGYETYVNIEKIPDNICIR
ncbi:MAG: hypothetical protein L6461_10695 [Anaerolineae bacterium]|nr:hypothetical protein [Anaerolineae bacterium]